MADPQTVNVGIIVPLTGADVDTWGEDAVNPNMVALDGLLAGVQTIAASNVPITLTAPAGFTPTPSPGPTQSQNRVLRFTGALSANVRVTLPLPGSYLIDNRTTGNFVLSFQGVTATEVVAVNQGNIVEIYNDGANVRFVNLGKVGAMELWAGISTLPAWVLACTKLPYLACDGSTVNYNVSDYPYLGAQMVGVPGFGGNGVTTFGIPDMAGRYPLAYDRTGTRVTTAGSGLNGQTLGAVNGANAQFSQLVTANLPPYTPSGTIVNGAITINQNAAAANSSTTGGGGFQCGGGTATITASQAASTFTGTAQGGSSQTFSNMPPTQVTGIWVIKT